MTTVVVNAGACGFMSTINADKKTGKVVAVTLETDCEMVRSMQQDVAELDRFAVLAGFDNNPVFKSAARCLKHPACPVPSAILKAIEVEAGMNVCKDALIVFKKKGA